MSAHLSLRSGAPDLIDPVVGYRQWHVEDGMLRSPYSRTAWSAPQLSAACGLAAHAPAVTPGADCTCGIYAYYEPLPRTASLGSRRLVAGAVVLWGDIELHGNGMRAAHCRIVALERPAVPGRKRAAVERVAAALAVPVVTHRALISEASRHGLSLPAAIRPPRYRPGPGVAAAGWSLPTLRSTSR